MKESKNLTGMHAGASPVIFQRAQLLRDNMTEPEKLLWAYLKQKPLGFKFRRQHPFHNYILDFYCHRARISIEIDGKSHDSLDHKEHDQIRTQLIEKLGVREMRFMNEEVINKPQFVIEQIEELLRAVSLQGIYGRAEGENK